MEKKTLEQLLAMPRKEQNLYLATLPDGEAEQLAQAIFKAEADRTVQKLVDNLNKNADNS
ncbi:MAG TPA: hypothetical protein VFC02_12070 [Anaerolineales bacterium]|nr:hypothetical protein [Anaerolineales bacterium]